MTDTLKYKRVVLKISGESLCETGSSGVETAQLNLVADEIASAKQTGVELALVIGAGNLLRGRDLSSPDARKNIHRTTADYMGMLGTVMNAIAVRDALEARGLPTVAMSAIPMPTVCEPYCRRDAVASLRAGKVVIFAGGTGSPFFTTDMCAALRAAEIDAQVVMKATKVDGVYDRDPVNDPSAVKYDQLTYGKVLADALGVMDLTAITMCMESQMPIMVFQFDKPGNLRRALAGEHVGTVISE